MRAVLLTAVLLVVSALFGQYDHVVVTTDSFVSHFAPMCRFVEDSLGLNDTVVTVENIYVNFPGRDGPERIRNFIRFAYSNWSTTHVLLGGDVEIVPCRYGYVQCQGVPLAGQIPVDLYYSDLDRDWNLDGDTLFGEPEDSVDLYPDVHVARVPATVASSVDKFVEKFMTYCSRPAAEYLRNVLLTGFDLALVPEVLGEITMEFYDSAYVPVGMKPCNKVYDSHSGHHADSVLSYLEAGQHLWIHSDHSSPTGVGCGDINHGWRVSSHDVLALGNAPDYTIMATIGCNAGRFDDTDCFTECFVMADSGGGVAAMGNSRAGVADARNPQRKYAPFLVEGFVRAALGHPGHGSLADFSLARAQAAPLADTNTIYRWSVYCMNMMGEPAMPVWVPDGSGVEETPNAELRMTNVPTVVRGVLRMPASGDAVLLDITGREVMDLPGAHGSVANGAVRHHDVRHLASGVYFVRFEQGGAATGTKLVVRR